MPMTHFQLQSTFLSSSLTSDGKKVTFPSFSEPKNGLLFDPRYLFCSRPYCSKH